MSNTACDLLPVRLVTDLLVAPRVAVPAAVEATAVIWMIWMPEFRRPLALALSDR